MRPTAVLCCLLAFGVPRIGTAQVPTTTLDDTITVTADRVEAPRDAVGSSVTVLTEDDIKRLRKVTVAAVLRTVPGLEVTRTAGPGSVTSVFLRGGPSSATLVLIDGVRANSPATGGFDFGDLQVDNIERIEIVRGPQSMLYGSEAMAGVISITTMRGVGPAAGSLDAATGDDGFWRLGGQVSGGNDRFDYALAASRTTTDGVSSASETAGNLEADGHENTTASARLGFRLGEDGRLDVSVRAVDAELDIDGFGFTGTGFGPVDDLNARQLRESFVGSVVAEVPLSRRWTQRVSVSLADDELVGDDPDSPFNNFVTDVQTLAFGTDAQIEVGDGGTFIAGLQHEERDGLNPGSFDESVDLTSFFAQHRLTFGERSSLTLGVRNDDHSTFGDETTYRVTGAAAFGDPSGATGRVHASFGTGFRAPSLNELFFPFFGNPSLRPETSRGFDLGVGGRWREGRLTADLTYFDTDYDDLIGVDASFTAINIDQAEVDGFELSLGFAPSERWRIGLSHSVTETVDRATGNQLPRRPENRTVLDLFVSPSARWDATVTVINVADRVDVGNQPLGDYVRVDLSTGYRLRDTLELYVRAENLFDEDEEEILGFTTPGRTAAAGLRLGF